MRSWGVTLLILGIGSFILPFFGIEFMLVSLVSDNPYIGGAVFSLVGGVMMLAGKKAQE